MIMVSDITSNSITNQAAPSWGSADNFAALLSQQNTGKNGFFRTIADKLKRAH